MLLHGGGLQERQGSTLDAEPFLTMKDVQPSEATREWLMVGLTLQPKLAWWVHTVDSGLMRHSCYPYTHCENRAGAPAWLQLALSMA